MATFELTSPDGQTYEVEGPDDATEEQAFAILQQSLGTTTDLDEDLPPLLEAGEEFGRPPSPSFGNQALRGAGLATRSIGGAIPKVATSLADIVGTVLNAGDRGLQTLFGFDNPSPFPTDNTAHFDSLLDEFLPTPDTLGERILNTGGEMAFTGGAGAAALAPKAGRVASAPSTQGIARNLGDDIGEFFAKSPVKSSVIEGSGGVGAATGQELAAEADLSPGGQGIATLVGGVLGGVTPQGVVNTSRKAATGITNAVDNAFSGELRAARALQESSANPEAAAKAALDAPEGVLPARAADEAGTRALESKTLADDPVAAAKAQTALEGAESKTLKELSDQFGPTTDRDVWQQEVIVRAAPDNAEIRVGQPDEMLDDAAKAFGTAYDDVAGFKVRTDNVQVEGGNVSMRTLFSEATNNKGIIADSKWRKGVSNFLNGLLDDVISSTTKLDGVDVVDSKTLLEMRSAIRAQQRTRAKAGVNAPRAAAEADMLQSANRAVTDVIESQLPTDAAKALRATDARYKDFLTVQGAVIRSGDKGLTPEALKSSLRTRETAGNVARGKTGELGTLAERGRDVAATLGKPQEAARVTRNMTADQLKAAKADFNEAIAQKATPGDGSLRGKKYLEQIAANEETLLAAGFTKAELGQMRTVGRQLQMIQSRSPGAVKALLTDDVGRVMRFLGAVAGSKSGSRLLKFMGGAGGAGPSLIVSQYGSRMMQDTLTKLSVDQADAMIRATLLDRELFAAAMTQPTASIKKQADAARTMQAWLARTASDETEDE